MNVGVWVQLVLFIGILGLLTKPLGLHLLEVLQPSGRPFLLSVLAPIEKAIYRFCRVDAERQQNWRSYTCSVLAFSFVSMISSYLVLRLQGYLPLNPQGFSGVKPDLAFNAAVSFATNTNWQSYSGESTVSYFTQMFGLASQNFFSAAVGIAVSAAVSRGIGRDKREDLGNFWVDLVRIHLYLLLPLSLILAVFLVSQGSLQNFLPYVRATRIDPSVGDPIQLIAQGPVASQIAIKMLGTNGGGFFNANAAHPFENPSVLSNFVQMLAIFLIPSALTYYFGRVVQDQRHAWTIWWTMTLLFLIGFFVCFWAEAVGNPRFSNLGLDMGAGNLEGKELRFGIFNSTLFATVTTAASCGAVNAMHDSFTPLGGLVPMVNMQLGEIIFGGVGAGLYGILMYVILAIFMAGLMVGRTPEYLGKKVEAYDVKAAVLVVLVAAVSILGFTAWATMNAEALAGLQNAGPHGLSEMLYAFSSAVANNGSSFAGLRTNGPWYNTTLATAMFLGRFFIMIPVMALAGHFAAKKRVARSAGSFPVSGPMFAILLAGTVLIIGALTYLPVLALGPIIEHFLMVGSHRVF